MPKFQWDHPVLPSGAQVPFTNAEIEKSVSTSADPYQVHFVPGLLCLSTTD